MPKIGGIFVRTDDPAYLETQIEVPEQVYAFQGQNVAELRRRYRERQANFSTTPFDPEGKFLRLFPGGFTIWSGHPGHGKTTILRQLACHLLHRGQGVFVCSLEEHPEDVFMRHCAVALGREDPSDDGVQWCMDSWEDRLRIWQYRPASSDARHQKIFAAVRVMARDYGVRHVIIDSLMCLDVPGTDWEAQRLFTQSLAATCELSGCHVHLVAHPRKPAQNNQESDIGDIAGSADLGRKADNVLFVKRATNEQQAMVDPNLRHMIISIKKQRYGTGHICDISGFFHVRLRQFVLDQFQREPTRYLSEQAYVDEWRSMDLPPEAYRE